MFIENAIAENLFSEIEQIVLNERFVWHYISSRTTNNHQFYKHKGAYHLMHPVFANDQHLSPVSKLLNDALKSSLKVNQIHKIRINCMTYVGENFVIHDPHVDINIPHKTALLYLTSSDGDTIIYNEKYDHTSNIIPPLYYKDILGEKLTIKETITPKRNCLYVFDGLHYHSASSTVSDSRRIVVNFNYN